MRYKILENKNALITGASGGLGREIALEFVKHGCNLYLIGRNERKLEVLEREASAYNVKVEYSIGDFRDIEEINAIVADVRRNKMEIDILVNSAGVFPVKSLEDSTIDDFENCFNINVRAPFILFKAFSPVMVKKQWGRIINIGSSSAYQGFKDTSIYCASKHALLGLSRSLHDELKDNNVRVYCISPGSIKTEMGKKVKNQNFETFIDPKDIAKYISFVISFDSEIITNEIRLNRMVIQ